MLGTETLDQSLKRNHCTELSKMCSVDSVEGYGYGSLTELIEVPGMYTDVAPVPVPAPGYFWKRLPVTRVLSHGGTELTEGPGVGINVV